MQTKTSVSRRPGSPIPCCRSGKCPDCAENARWDRLFQQNAVDPYYYSRRQVLWRDTPLASSSFPVGAQIRRSSAPQE